MGFSCRGANLLYDVPDYSYTNTNTTTTLMPQAVVASVAGLGSSCAVGQIVLVLLYPGLRENLVRRVLALVALLDIAGCVWWLTYSNDVLQKGASGYPSASECRWGELLLLASEIIPGWLMILLGFYAATLAHFEYSMVPVPPRVKWGFGAAGVLLPVVELAVPAVWAMGAGSCPLSDGDADVLSTVWDASTGVYIASLLFVAAVVAATAAAHRLRRHSSCRLLLLPASVIAARGLGPFVWAAGWLRGGCGGGWLSVWAVLSPLHPVVNLLLYFANERTVAAARAGPSDDKALLLTQYSDSEESTDAAENDLDVLWGRSTQVLFVHRASPVGGDVDVGSREGSSGGTIATTHLGCTVSDHHSVFQSYTPSAGINSPSRLLQAAVVCSPQPVLSATLPGDWEAPAAVGAVNPDTATPRTPASRGKWACRGSPAPL
eukprot:TRINITY_DN11748_c0_g3_i2.p1 TRINITY_DN11748_c0_g3~~TRINITY_DN11748_c0_g3_i2.p1  ORF type:complete len:434 (+),score=105.99 TRINITY_DN11748_c0_g3_i2:56-1357(+)